MSFKDKVEGNELDLSLNQLTDVPVKELAATPKATHLDLTCNLLQTLPNDFASLIHLVKIDLGRNNLTELPPNFGNLVNLQLLDLDKNKLRNVPLSFCRLKNLRWLDLKDNPLEPKLQSIAGDCLDEKQCQSCAKKVVSYMQTIESNLEREKQKKLKEIREKEAIQKAKMDKELEEQRKLKKIEKERRRAESKARNEEKLMQIRQNVERDSSHSETESREESEEMDEDGQGMNWFKWLFILLLCLAVGGAGYVMATSKTPLKNFSKDDVQILAKLFAAEMTDAAIDTWNFIILFADDAKNFVLSQIHGTMMYISKLATELESMLSVYF